jgi:hypothetical protein
LICLFLFTFFVAICSVSLFDFLFLVGAALTSLFVGPSLSSRRRDVRLGRVTEDLAAAFAIAAASSLLRMVS